MSLHEYIVSFELMLNYVDAIRIGYDTNASYSAVLRSTFAVHLMLIKGKVHCHKSQQTSNDKQLCGSVQKCFAPCSSFDLVLSCYGQYTYSTCIVVLITVPYSVNSANILIICKSKILSNSILIILSYVAGSFCAPYEPWVGEFNAALNRLVFTEQGFR